MGGVNVGGSRMESRNMIGNQMMEQQGNVVGSRIVSGEGGGGKELVEDHMVGSANEGGSMRGGRSDTDGRVSRTANGEGV